MPPARLLSAKFYIGSVITSDRKSQGKKNKILVLEELIVIAKRLVPHL